MALSGRSVNPIFFCISRWNSDIYSIHSNVPETLRYYFNWVQRNEKHFPPTCIKHSQVKRTLRNVKKMNKRLKRDWILPCLFWFITKCFEKKLGKRPHLFCIFHHFYSNEKNCLVLWEPRWQGVIYTDTALCWAVKLLDIFPLMGFYFEQLIPVLTFTEKIKLFKYWKSNH